MLDPEHFDVGLLLLGGTGHVKPFHRHPPLLQRAVCRQIGCEPSCRLRVFNDEASGTPSGAHVDLDVFVELPDGGD